MPGSNPGLCGKGGVTCKACGNGEQCQSQECKAVACNATTCAGKCCDAKGNCVPGTTEAACGNTGATCTTCGNNQSCQAGTCKDITVKCDATSCPSGCCDKNGNCAPGNTATACGSGGTACQTCGTGLGCSNAKCTCTPTSCSTGCCQGDTCKAGSENSACGKNGQACTSCSGATACSAGSCQSGCSYLTCAGCCDASKVCHDPANSSNCGLFGNTCSACSGSNICDPYAGNCNDDSKCDTTTCASGCCKNGSCQTGKVDSACGDGGYTCETCGGASAPHLFCGTDPYWGRQCIANNNSTWDMMIDHVEVRAKDASGNPVVWDSFLEGDAPPEMYVKVTVAGVSAQSKAAPEGYTADFNAAYLLTAKSSDLQAKIHFEIYDSDIFFGDQKIVACDDVIYPAELKSGLITLSSCSSDPSNLDFIEIRFKFKVKTP